MWQLNRKPLGDDPSCGHCIGKHVPLNYFYAFIHATVGFVEVLGMLWDYEVIFDAVNEKGWNVGLFDMVSDGIQSFYIEIMLIIKGDTFYWMVDFRKLRAMPLKTESPPPCFSASYLDSFYKLEKGESSTKQPIS